MKVKIILPFVFCFIIESSLAQSQVTSYELGGYDVQIIGDLGAFTLDWNKQIVEEGVEIATIKLSSKQANTPPQFALKWNLPSSNVAGTLE